MRFMSAQEAFDLLHQFTDEYGQEEGGKFWIACMRLEHERRPEFVGEMVDYLCESNKAHTERLDIDLTYGGNNGW